MKKVLAVLMVVALLSGCEMETKEVTHTFLLPKGLEDCSIYSMSATSGAHIQAVRCPHSSTASTYKVGKSTQTTIVIDGVEYKPAK